MALREAPHLLMHSNAPDTPVYQVGSVAVETGSEDAEPVPFPSPEFVGSMDATRGLKVFKKCTSCHNADNGGANGTGPNLWNIVGAAAGAKDGFKYSGSMVGSDLKWDYETLDGFLTKPTKYLSGTNMNFIGLKKEADRAAVIELLRQASDNPIAAPVAAIAEDTMMEEKMMDEKMVEETMEKMEDKAMEKMDEMKTETVEH